jgi:hypothetical protein
MGPKNYREAADVMGVGLAVEPRERSRQFRAGFVPPAMGSRPPPAGDPRWLFPHKAVPHHASTPQETVGCHRMLKPPLPHQGTQAEGDWHVVLPSPGTFGDIQALCGGADRPQV